MWELHSKILVKERLCLIIDKCWSQKLCKRAQKISAAAPLRVMASRLEREYDWCLESLDREYDRCLESVERRMFCTGGSRACIRRPNMSQICYMGFKSGLMAGQGTEVKASLWGWAATALER